MLTNEQLEIEILSTLIFEESYQQYIATLSEEDFTTRIHKKIFRTLQKFYNADQPIDLITVSDAIPEVSAYLTQELANAVVYNIEEHIQMLKDYTKRRALLDLTLKINKALQARQDTNAIITAISNYIEKLETPAKQGTHMMDLALREIERIEERWRNKDDRSWYLPSLTKWSELTVGFHPGELSILAARPAVGKSALSLQIAEELSKNGKKIKYYSLEMSESQIMQRFYARYTGISLQKLRTGHITQEEWDLLSKASALLSDLPLWIDCDIDGLEDIYMDCLAHKRKYGLDMVIIDYLQLITTRVKKENRTQEVGHITRQLKKMSKKLNVPILALAQLSRAPEARKNQRPILSDLRESGNIEQDADNVFFLFKDEQNGDWQKYFKETGKQKIELITAKQRNGATGIIETVFDPAIQKFFETVRREET